MNLHFDMFIHILIFLMLNIPNDIPYTKNATNKEVATTPMKYTKFIHTGKMSKYLPPFIKSSGSWLQIKVRHPKKERKASVKEMQLTAISVRPLKYSYSQLIILSSLIQPFNQPFVNHAFLRNP